MYVILTPVAISDCSGSSTPVRYNTHACIFLYTFSWCSIHIPFFGHHSHCVRISSVTSCNTGQLVTDSLAFSYLPLILSLAIRHSCIKVVQKRSNRKPHRYDTHYSHLSNTISIRESRRLISDSRCSDFTGLLFKPCRLLFREFRG